MMKSWPFRLEKYRLSTMKAYRYAGKQENPFQWYIATYVLLIVIVHDVVLNGLDNQNE